MVHKALFITFEGPEGSGKSTHVRLLADYLKTQGHRILLTREPGGSRLSAGFRKLLLDGGEGLLPRAELFLYEADRAQHVAEVIVPALQKGLTVICDRYTDSTRAYQGFGRGLPHLEIACLNDVASQGLVPDLTILLDVPVKKGLQNAKTRKNGPDRIERAGLAFHNRVRNGFLAMAKAEPKRFRVIRQQAKPEETQRLIRKAVDAKR